MNAQAMNTPGLLRRFSRAGDRRPYATEYALDAPARTDYPLDSRGHALAPRARCARVDRHWSCLVRSLARDPRTPVLHAGVGTAALWASCRD